MKSKTDPHSDIQPAQPRAGCSMHSKWNTVTLGTDTDTSNRWLLQENSPLQQTFPEILLQVTEISASARTAVPYPGFSKAQRVPGDFPLHEQLGWGWQFDCIPSPAGSGWATPQHDPTAETAGGWQRRRSGALPLCCASSGTTRHRASHTATVSMVSARPISVLGYETTQQAHFLVSASFSRTNSSKEEK